MHDARSRPAVPLWALVALLVAGAGSTVLYALATSRMLLWDFFPSAGISLDWIKMLGPSRREPAVAYLQLVTGTSVLYVVALGVAARWRARVPRLVWFGFPIVFVVALLFMYPPTAVDLFHYHADARTLWIARENPLLIPPAETGYQIGISWADQPSPYGPAWSLLTMVLAPLMIFGDHGVATLVGFKLLAAVSYLGCAWLVYRIVASTRPEMALFAFVLFAWNPFVLLRAVGNGHNDLTMLFFALLALLLARRGEWTLVFAVLALSVLIKYTTALLGPPLLLYAWYQLEGSPRERVRALAPGILYAGVLTVIIYAPFWAGMDTFDTVRRQAELMITSTPDVMQTLLVDVMDEKSAARLARNGAIAAFLLLAVPIVWQARRGYDFLLASGFNLLFFYLVIASAWFRPWYMLWPAALIALRPTRWGIALFLAITLSNLFPDIIEQYRFDWGATTVLEVRAWPVAAQFVLPLAVWLAGALHTRSLHLGASSVPEPPRASPDIEGEASYVAT